LRGLLPVLAIEWVAALEGEKSETIERRGRVRCGVHDEDFVAVVDGGGAFVYGIGARAAGAFFPGELGLSDEGGGARRVEGIGEANDLDGVLAAIYGDVHEVVDALECEDGGVDGRAVV